jgi:predicted RecA/RadA family phage recombinase
MHADDTTSVHGIADTADLVTTAVTDALDARLDALDTPTVTLTDAATVVIDAAAGPHQRVVVGGNRTIGKPSSGVDGRLLVLTIVQDSTGSRAWTLHSDYRLRSGDTATPSTTAGARDELAVQYDATDDKWDVLAYRRGDGDVVVAGKRWRSGDQTIGGFGDIGLNSDTFLLGGTAASGAGISVPVAGLYLCVAAIYIKPGDPGGGARNGIFAVNGTSAQEFGLTIASGEVRLSGTAVLSLAASDVVTLQLFQNGDTGDVGGGAEKDTSLTVRYLSPAA